MGSPERKAYYAAWYQANREEQLAKCKTYVRENAAAVAARKKRWYEANKDRILAAARERYGSESEEWRAARVARLSDWKLRNPEAYRAGKKAAKWRRRGASGDAAHAQVEARVVLWGCRCWLCGEPWREVDHMKPIARGGSNWPANLRPACSGCNRRKHARIVEARSRYLPRPAGRLP